MPINQPSTNIKLTNVSLVRMKKAKKRFEIACYKNKVMEWRNGNETDLDNVLQIPNVFINVSKGQVANHQDLEKAFGLGKNGVTTDSIILEILNKGELQVGDKERQAQLERIKNEVIDMVAARLVDPKSKRVYTPGIIEKALDQLSTQSHHQQHDKDKDKDKDNNKDKDKPDAEASEPPSKPKPNWTGVVTTKSAKLQALDAIKALLAHQPIPIARARMKLRITCPAAMLKHTVKAKAKSEEDEGDAKASTNFKDYILSLIEQVESQEVTGSDWECIGFVEPGLYKDLTEFIGNHTKGKARAEVLDMAVVHEGDS